MIKITDCNKITIDRFDEGVNLNFNIKNPDGTPFDLLGYDAQFIVKADKDKADTTAIYDTIDELIIDVENSTIRVPIREKLSSHKAGGYYYALRLLKDKGIEGNYGFVYTAIQGNLYIKDNVFESGV